MIGEKVINKKEVSINTIKKFFFKLLTLINFNIFLFSKIKISCNINIEFRIIDKNLILKPNCIKIDVKKEKRQLKLLLKVFNRYFL